MTDGNGALDELLTRAKDADPAHRIDLRDAIAAHGAAAIEAVTPWLKVPTLAAFAIRVIARAGLDGERETAQATLRQARRRLDARLRADADWALGVLRAELAPEPAPATRTLPAARSQARPAAASAGRRHHSRSELSAS